MSENRHEATLRLNRFLARSGLGSRRGVEEIVRAGRVTVNGRAVFALETRIKPGRDTVAVDGRQLSLPQTWRVYAFHKPLGTVSTLRPQGAQTGLEAFRRAAGLPESVIPVGRLDADSTGLLIWTDDGELAQALLRPRQAVWKGYEVVLDGPLRPAALRALVGGGLVLDGRTCLPARAAPLAGARGRRWLLHLQEGRNRQVRRMFGALALRVVSLHRVEFGPIRLGHVRPGAFRRLGPEEVAALRRAAGLPADPYRQAADNASGRDR